MSEKVFLALVPLLFFLRHCRINLPQSPFPWANWIIDDPNLTPRYGFLDIRELAKCVRETGVAASIAFIPWNHRRTARDVVSLFKQDWPNFRFVCMGVTIPVRNSRPRQCRLPLPLVDLAYRRMAQLERETSLGFDRVMVFPQGRFSARSNARSSCKSDALSCEHGIGGLPDRHGCQGARTPETCDYVVWRFSVVYETPGGRGIRKFCAGSAAREALSYRYPSSVFRRWIEATSCCVDRLNALQPDMIWTNLERGILSTYSVCSSSNDSQAVRLYSACTTVQPQTDRDYFVYKTRDRSGNCRGVCKWDTASVQSLSRGNSVHSQGRRLRKQ